MYDEEEQEKINQGQRWINYQLTHVDEGILQALKLCVNSLREIKAALPPSPEAKGIDLTKIEAAISAADDISNKVASIKPPGCEAPPYPLGG
jgi:hypothetical protein